MEKYILIYLSAVSLFAVITCIADKIFAIKGMWRISEKMLFTVSAIGGAAAMYITMLLIRHKTKHKRFMIGLPLIIAVHAVILIKILA